MDGWASRGFSAQADIDDNIQERPEARVPVDGCVGGVDIFGVCTH